MYKTLHILLLFVLGLLVHTNCWAVSFSNFSKKLELTPESNGYFSLPSGHKVKISNRIVIKATHLLSKNQIKALDDRILKVQEIFKLNDSWYSVATFKNQADLNSILQKVSLSKEILLAQPDLLQIIEKSHQPNTLQNQSHYLEHLNLSSYWRNTKGENIRIAIIDDGFDLEHEDLKNTRLVFGYDIDSQTLNPFPKTKYDVHGTQVAGIIFAEHNELGIDGIAPKADLIAIRHTDTWTSKTVLSFYLAKLAKADVINCSWTPKFLLEPIADAIQDLTTYGRNKKGTAIVFAAGNNSKLLNRNSNAATISNVIAVGSADAHGIRLPFSNYGPGVDFYTYGEGVRTPYNGDKKYKLFSGSSASAAIVSGVSAILLSQDNEMSLSSLHNQLTSLFGTN